MKYRVITTKYENIYDIEKKVFFWIYTAAFGCSSKNIEDIKIAAKAKLKKREQVGHVVLEFEL